MAIEVKFCTAKRTHVPVGPAKFDVNRCNESPLWGENPDFGPVSKFNTGSLPLCGILPVINNIRCIVSVRPQSTKTRAIANCATVRTNVKTATK